MALNEVLRPPPLAFPAFGSVYLVTLSVGVFPAVPPFFIRFILSFRF
jgi:hypothetical protein